MLQENTKQYISCSYAKFPGKFRINLFCSINCTICH